MATASSKENDDAFRLIPTALASSIAASLARIPVHPIDSIKSILQASKTKTSFGEVLRNSSVTKLYRGLGIAVVGSVPAGALYFTTYEIDVIFDKTTKHALHEKHKTIAHFAAGMTAEAVSCSIWLPIDVVKERRQVQLDRKLYKSDFDALRQIYNSPGGIRALYRGYFATLFSFGPFSGVYFTVYEALKTNLTDPGYAATLAIGAFSGAIAAFITSPLDMTKLRLQVQSQSHDYQYKGFWNGLKSIMVNEGLNGLFRGASTRIVL